VQHKVRQRPFLPPLLPLQKAGPPPALHTDSAWFVAHHYDWQNYPIQNILYPLVGSYGSTCYYQTRTGRILRKFADASPAFSRFILVMLRVWAFKIATGWKCDVAGTSRFEAKVTFPGDCFRYSFVKPDALGCALGRQGSRPLPILN